MLPIYQQIDALDNKEKALLNNIENVFSKREIILVVPNSIAAYWQTNSDFDVISFKDEFFKNKLTYSKLLCSKKFYESFICFDYIQILQLDCWVFEDRLDYFSSIGFDFIGAPWMKGSFEGEPKRELWKVGNGGFSLRKTSVFLTILNEIEDGAKGKLPVFRGLKKGSLGKIKDRGFRNNLKHYVKQPPGEDIFWSIYVPRIFGNDFFKIADTISASYYSFEVFPDFLINEITKGKLPMGCHNWMNNNPNFWKKHIKI